MHPKKGAPKYINQILTGLIGELYSNTLMVGDLISPFMSVDISFRQEINKQTLALNSTLDQVKLTDYIYIHREREKEHFIQKQQNIHSFQVHMEHFPR